MGNATLCLMPDDYHHDNTLYYKTIEGKYGVNTDRVLLACVENAVFGGCLPDTQQRLVVEGYPNVIGVKHTQLDVSQGHLAV